MSSSEASKPLSLPLAIARALRYWSSKVPPIKIICCSISACLRSLSKIDSPTGLIPKPLERNKGKDLEVTAGSAQSHLTNEPIKPLLATTVETSLPSLLM